MSGSDTFPTSAVSAGSESVKKSRGAGAARKTSVLKSGDEVTAHTVQDGVKLDDVIEQRSFTRWLRA